MEQFNFTLYAEKLVKIHKILQFFLKLNDLQTIFNIDVIERPSEEKSNIVLFKHTFKNQVYAEMAFCKIDLEKQNLKNCSKYNISEITFIFNTYGDETSINLLIGTLQKDLKFSDSINKDLFIWMLAKVNYEVNDIQLKYDELEGINKIGMLRKYDRFYSDKLWVKIDEKPVQKEKEETCQIEPEKENGLTEMDEIEKLIKKIGSSKSIRKLDMSQEYKILRDKYDKDLLNFVIIADDNIGKKSNLHEQVKDQMNHTDKMLVKYMKQLGDNKKKSKEKI